jgi:hypothetical protein
MAYIFDPDVVHECSLASLNRPKPAMFDAFAPAMEERYPTGSTSTSRGSTATPAAR